METEQREEKKSCPETPLSSRDPELDNQLLFCVHMDLRKCTIGVSSYPGDLLQVGEGDGLAGQHLMGLAGERRQRRQLLPMGQAAAQHSQTGAGGGEVGVGTGSQATVIGPTSPGRPHPSDQRSR